MRAHQGTNQVEATFVHGNFDPLVAWEASSCTSKAGLLGGVHATAWGAPGTAGILLVAKTAPCW